MEDKILSKHLLVLDYLSKGYEGVPFEIDLWGKSIFRFGNLNEATKFKLFFRSPNSLKQSLFPPTELNITESYFNDVFDIEGDLFSVFDAAFSLSRVKRSLFQKVAIISSILSLHSGASKGLGKEVFKDSLKVKHSKGRDSEAVKFHYDVSNEFYAKWLGETMVYSGAYFKTRYDSLDLAQINKLDFICKKLRLKPGETLLDIGCGWGSLILHAAKNYGVIALGVTLSENQAEFAINRIKEENLSDRVSVKLSDYRDLDESVKFDKISSVEMLHHVGDKNTQEYFEKISKLQNRNSLSFHLAITNNPSKGKYRGPKFTQKYFMPDYDLIPVSKLIKYAEQSKFEVLDVECLREHYDLTAEHWLRNIEKLKGELQGIAGDTIYRVWRLSMALLSYGFKRNLINLYHIVLANDPEIRCVLPLNREDVYS